MKIKSLIQSSFLVVFFWLTFGSCASGELVKVDLSKDVESSEWKVDLSFFPEGEEAKVYSYNLAEIYTSDDWDAGSLEFLQDLDALTSLRVEMSGWDDSIIDLEEYIHLQRFLNILLNSVFGDGVLDVSGGALGESLVAFLNADHFAYDFTAFTSLRASNVLNLTDGDDSSLEGVRNDLRGYIYLISQLGALWELHFDNNQLGTMLADFVDAEELKSVFSRLTTIDLTGNAPSSSRFDEDTDDALKAYVAALVRLVERCPGLEIFRIEPAIRIFVNGYLELDDNSLSIDDEGRVIRGDVEEVGPAEGVLPGGLVFQNGSLSSDEEGREGDILGLIGVEFDTGCI